MLLSVPVLTEIAAAAGLSGAAAWLTYQKLYVPVPPNKALILFGRNARRSPVEPGSGPSRDRSRPPRVLLGGGAVLAPWNKSYAYLSLAPVDVEVTVRALHSVEGGKAAGWEVSLAVQAKLPAEAEALQAAAENLFGMGPAEVAAFVRRSVEASVPLVLARLGVGDAEPDWDRLGAEIQATLAPELVPSGLVVRSVAVRELRRLAPSSGPDASREDVARPPPLRAPSPRASEEVDARLRRIEHGLRAMGSQVDRWLRERPEHPYPGFPLYDPAIGPAAPVAAGSLDDSTEDGRPPFARAPAPTGRPRGAAEGAASSDEVTPR